MFLWSINICFGFGCFLCLSYFNMRIHKQSLNIDQLSSSASSSAAKALLSLGLQLIKLNFFHDSNSLKSYFITIIVCFCFTGPFPHVATWLGHCIYSYNIYIHDMTKGLQYFRSVSLYKLISKSLTNKFFTFNFFISILPLRVWQNL